MNLRSYQVTVTFDRVFDIVRDTGNDKEPSTLFSFQHGAKHEYGVTVPGEPELSDGMTVTAILRDEENWQTLMGWVNHKTGELVCKTRHMWAIFLVLPILFLAFTILNARPFLGICMLLFSTVLLCSLVWQTYRLTKVRQTLEDLGSRHEHRLTAEQIKNE